MTTPDRTTPLDPPTADSDALSEEQAAERQRMIEEIVSDTTMPVTERQARLEALAREWGLGDSTDGDEVTNPLELQIFEALTLLAEGGHSQR